MNLDWRRLKILDLVKFFNVFLIPFAAGNGIQIYGSFMGFSTTDFEVDTFEKLIGLGCFFAWVNIW